MVVEIAQGLEDPTQIAERYGLTPTQFGKIAKHRAFRLAVLAKMSELKTTGVTFKLRASVMAERLLDLLYKRATDDQAATATTLEVAKWLAKMGQLEPKEEKVGPAQVGTGFSVTINLNQPAEVEVSKDGQVARIGPA
jgi:N-acetylglutamate synthase-like GNAT family acetyltransferase